MSWMCDDGRSEAASKVPANQVVLSKPRWKSVRSCSPLGRTSECAFSVWEEVAIRKRTWLLKNQKME